MVRVGHLYCKVISQEFRARGHKPKLCTRIRVRVGVSSLPRAQQGSWLPRQLATSCSKLIKDSAGRAHFLRDDSA